MIQVRESEVRRRGPVCSSCGKGKVISDKNTHTISVLSGCGHAYHSSCIEPFLFHTGVNCVACNQLYSSNVSECIKLYLSFPVDDRYPEPEETVQDSLVETKPESDTTPMIKEEVFDSESENDLPELPQLPYDDQDSEEFGTPLSGSGSPAIRAPTVTPAEVCEAQTMLSALIEELDKLEKKVAVTVSMRDHEKNAYDKTISSVHDKTTHLGSIEAEMAKLESEISMFKAGIQREQEEQAFPYHLLTLRKYADAALTPFREEYRAELFDHLFNEVDEQKAVDGIATFFAFFDKCKYKFDECNERIKDNRDLEKDIRTLKAKITKTLEERRQPVSRPLTNEALSGKPHRPQDENRPVKKPKLIEPMISTLPRPPSHLIQGTQPRPRTDEEEDLRNFGFTRGKNISFNQNIKLAKI